MIDDIRRSERGERTAYLNVGIWYDAENDSIHLTLPKSNWFHTTVNANPESKRGHLNLFKKLAKALRSVDLPAPSFGDDNTSNDIQAEEQHER